MLSNIKSNESYYENKTLLSTRNQTTLHGQRFKTNIQDILELVNYTNDIVLLTKAFYSLGLYLLSQESSCDQIIKCRFLYDKILLVLNCCLQTKVSVALDFISVLLLFGDDQGFSKRKSLLAYAENMIRTSGCLAAMCNIFTSCMMQRGPLRCLCVSLSVAVRSSQAQAQCAHLVPLCIIKCRQEHTEMFLLLQSLLSDNEGNIQLFHKCNGMNIFTRESLQYTECLFLLSTIVESTDKENIRVLKKSFQVFEIVESLLLKFDPGSNMEQWASIILYTKRKAEIDIEKEGGHPKSASSDESEKITYNAKKKTFIRNDNETTQLFRNVYKEIVTLQKENDRNNKNFNIPRRRDLIHVHGKMDYNFKMSKENFTKQDMIKNDIMTNDRNEIQINDLSFSFLRKINDEMRTTETFGEIGTDNFKPDYPPGAHKNFFEKTPTEAIDISQFVTSRKTESSIANYTIDFKPPFFSTPKKNHYIQYNNVYNKRTQSSRSYSTNPSSIRKEYRLNRNTQRYKRNINRTLIERYPNKSMSAKFFDLINNSCTTIAKSFTNIKNIFKPKITENIQEENTVTVEISDSRSCSYSFTNYMQERDMIREDCNLNKYLCETSNIYCNTCNDTDLLRQKLANDKPLQQTIKKLKLGINLYGCNFKKISRKMWPRDTYMTPTILYNLYRKLIIK